MKPNLLYLASVLLLAPVSPAEANTGKTAPISLAGTWRFALDRHDVGIQEKWHEGALPGKIKLPGSLPGQGIGDPPGLQTKWIGGIQEPNWARNPLYAPYTDSNNFKFPFWLQPETYYAGAAWYQRDVEIPESWNGKRVVLSLERPHWETRVWVDDLMIGTNNALGTPHEYDLGMLTPGKHILTVRVDNRLVVDVGPDSHSVCDHTQGNWNGVVGRLELRATPAVWIEDVQIFPDVARRLVNLKVRLGNRSGTNGISRVNFTAQLLKNGQPDLRVAPAVVATDAGWGSNGVTFETQLELGANAKLWDEFSPNLYELMVHVADSGADYVTRFGLREFGTQGTQFVINGRKTFIRGTLECAIFPKTGHPPTDVDSWKRILRIARAHGLNNLRFHSWCPPEAAFRAADEMGFYYQVEVSSWANSSSSLGDGKPVDEWLYEEADRMLKFYGNHPSFVLMPYGNEPGGRHHAEYLAKWVNHYKARDPRRLYTSGAGWPQIPENQFHVTPDPRIQAWGGGLKSRINALPPETRTDYAGYIAERKAPVISHEIGQWCVYPNFAEMRKYTGYLKPRNFEIFRDSLRAHHLGDLAKEFLLASGKLQTLCYKEDIESALRTRGMGGFQLLDLHDFPGQGTALVGVLDPFWEEKGYVTPEEYSRFCNATVPLARLAKRVFSPAETLVADIEVAHFGPAPLPGVTPAWKLTDARGKTVAAGKLAPRDVPVDNTVTVGQVSVPLGSFAAPARYRLVVSLANTPFENDWDIWVYPAKVDTAVPAGITITDQLNDQALATLQAGGKVLLTIPPNQVRGDRLGKVALGFSSIFWNTAWTHRQAPHTLGIYCEPNHPALADFPTEYHSNWQWWYLISRAGAMILDDLPTSLRPTVSVIDDWVTNRRLGLLFEARVGTGKLMVTSVDLTKDMADNPVARQFRYSVLRYMAGPRFKPGIAVMPEQIRALLAEQSGLQRLGARVQASSAQTAYEAEQAIDGDPATIWHTRYEPVKDPLPHWLVLDLGRERVLTGMKYLPRQDMANGRIAAAEIYCSNDPAQWGSPVARATWPNSTQPQTIIFDQPVKARYLQFKATAEVNRNSFAAVAELDILTKP